MYCRNCGKELNNQAKFCSSCGKSIEKVPTTESTYSIRKSSKNSQKQKKYSTPILFRIITSILIVALSISATIRLIKNNSSYSNKQNLLETLTVKVNKDLSIVSISNITIDVNSLNLTDKDTNLTIQKYSQTIGSDGFIGIEYDISLDDMNYLKAPLTVTLPYDKDIANNSEVCILHYDKDYGEWIPQETTIDTTAGTISTKLTSLSPVRLVYFNKDYSKSLYYIANKDHSNATLEVSYNYWTHIKNTPLEPAVIVAQDYTVNGNTISSTEALNMAIDSRITNVNTYYTLFGALMDTIYTSVNTVSTSGGLIKNVTEKASKGIGVLSLSIATAQLLFDLNTKKSTGPQNETAVNLYKNLANNGGVLYSFYTGYSSTALSAGFLSVAITGYVLDTLVEEAKTVQAETLEAVFNSYYTNISDFNEKDWYNIFIDAYWDAWQNNRNSQDGMNYAIEKVKNSLDIYAEKFWKEIYKDGDALTFAISESGKKNYFTPTANQKKELTYRFKVDMFKRFNSKVIPWINEFMMERMQDAIYSDLLSTVSSYNRYYRVLIQEIANEEKNEICKYQMSPIKLGDTYGFVQSNYPKEWEALAPEGKKEWATNIDFTLLSYIIAKAPDRVLVFDAWDEDQYFGNQIRTENFTLPEEESNYTAIIDLSSNENFLILDEGIYTGDIDGYNSAFRLLATQNGFIVAPCDLEGNYDSDLAVECFYDSSTQKYEGYKKEVKNNVTGELRYILTINKSETVPSFSITMKSTLNNKIQSWDLGVFNWKKTLTGASTNNDNHQEPEATLPPGYGVPVGGWGP